jgi:16S rRNA (adenine1518-N6/adenine1519-N6)-dimethyltransferase
VIPARKRWGQHFLVRGETASRIVEAASLRPEETVIEVGPGEGALTRPILQRARRLLAIEIDPLRIPVLTSEFGPETGLRLLAGDALTATFAEWLERAGWEPPAILLANLPYNVATPILLAALEEPGTIDRTVVTVQREVARRFVARPGEEGYGYLSVRAAAAATGRVLFDLPPSAFRPRPKVVSSVLEMRPRRDRLDPVVRRQVLEVASLAFRSRRKTLVNALSSLGGRGRWEEALVGRGLDPRVRGENLSLDDFVALARVAGSSA